MDLHACAWGQLAALGHSADLMFRWLCCEHCGCAMDTRSDFAETDLHILTLMFQMMVLERAAGAKLAITLVHCTNPLVWECPAMAASASSPFSASVIS